MRGEALFLFLITLVLETLGFVFVHGSPSCHRRGEPPATPLLIAWGEPPVIAGENLC